MSGRLDGGEMREPEGTRAAEAGGDADRLAERVHELDVTIASLADLVVVVDADGRVVACNGASGRVWGLTPSEVIGQLMPTASGRLVVIDRQGHITAPDAVPTARALKTGRSQRVPVLGIRRGDGTVSWALVVAVPVAAGTRVVSVWTDVTASVEREVDLARMNADLEQRIQARTAELEATIGELEAFSYSVSHDLRAPVRTISALAELLRDGGLATDSPEARDSVRRIHAAALRMDGLIEVLLELSTAARAEPRCAALDLSTLARDELQRLADRDRARAVHSIVQPNITAFGDERLIAIVLHNLLTNAWKFTSATTTPTIEVGTLQPKGRAGERVHFVRDNGIGFDMHEADDLFLPFRRLHSIREFDGIGVGLAIVHRIVTRHGGRVWAESTPGSGATFFFTLPEMT